MALTLKRWLTIALLACAAIAVWQLPPSGDGAAAPTMAGRTAFYSEDFGWVPRFGWPDASTRLGAATLHLRVLQIRDSVFTRQLLVTVKPGLTVRVDPQIPGPIDSLITQALRGAWTAQLPGTRYPVLAAIVHDTTRLLDGLPMSRGNSEPAYVFPPDSANPTCRVIARLRFSRDPTALKNEIRYVRWTLLRSGSNGESSWSILGTCELFATFGMPGPGVAHWLEQTEWRNARAVGWNRLSPALTDNDRRPFDLQQSFVDFLGLPDQSWRTRNYLSDDGVACIAGDAQRCIHGFVSPASPRAPDPAWRDHVIGVSAFGDYWGQSPSGSLGPTSEWIVSDMIHDFGRERFEKFWSSADPPEQAFEAATHEPLGPWLQQWARRAYGSDVVGASISARAVESGVVIILIGLFVAMGFSRERRVA